MSSMDELAVALRKVIADLIDEKLEVLEPPNNVGLLLHGPTPGRVHRGLNSMTRADVARTFYGNDDPKTIGTFWTNGHENMSSPYGTYLRYHLLTQGAPIGQSASTWAQAALPFDRPVAAVDMHYNVQFEAPFDPGRTGKVGGLVAYHGGDWPGGGKQSSKNCSLRWTWNRWSGKGPAVFAMYVYVQPETRILGNEDWVNPTQKATRQWVFRDWPIEPDVPYDLRIQADTRDGGTLRASINGALVMSTNDFRLVSDGPGTFTNAYLCGMYGGNTAWYGPESGEGFIQIHSATAREWVRG